MAAAAVDGINYHDIQTQCFSADSSVNCINCVSMKDQLHSALLELKTANTIISLLREDIIKATAREATNLPKPSMPGGSSKHERTHIGWIPVVHNSSKGKKTPMTPSRTTEKSYRSSNRFTPLANLPENLHDEVHPTSNHEWTSSSKATKESTSKPSTGYKIPTIVNGRVTTEENKKPVWTTKKPARVTVTKTNKRDHKVRIIGDSHLKGSAVRINQYLNTKFEVSSFIKPGACTNQLVHSQEEELLNLGKKDVIVINGGSNDIDNNANRNGILVRMTQFIQNHNNTNIIVLNIPHRHDLAMDSRPNLEIQTFNTKLAKITKKLQHVALFEMDFHRKHFTKHGLHLNNAGKEELAKLIAFRIDKLVNNVLEPMTALKWKKEPTNEEINAADYHKPNVVSSEDEFSKIMIPPIQIYNCQGDRTDSLPRTSNRQKKAPVTKSNDFLW